MKESVQLNEYSPCNSISKPSPRPICRSLLQTGWMLDTHIDKCFREVSPKPQGSNAEPRRNTNPQCHLHNNISTRNMQAFPVYHVLLLVRQNIFKNHQLMLYTCDSSSILAVAPGTCYKQIIGVNFANHQALEGGSTKILSSNIMTKMSVCPGENQTDHRCCGNP